MSVQFRFLAIAAAVFFGLAPVNVAQAASITFDFTTPCSVACGVTGTNGNTRTFLGSDGVTTVTAKAWGRTADSSAGPNTAFASAFLGHYTYGLGVTDQDESGSFPSHTMDNFNRYDLVAFYFNTTVEPQSARLRGFTSSSVSGDPDTDISAWIANVAGMPDLTGLLLAGGGPADDLNDLFGTRIDNAGPSGYYRTAMFGTGATGTFLIIAARIGETSPNDFIKIKHLTVDKPNDVPEPASLAIFLVGLAGLGFGLRRQRVVA